MKEEIAMELLRYYCKLIGEHIDEVTFKFENKDMCLTTRPLSADKPFVLQGKEYAKVDENASNKVIFNVAVKLGPVSKNARPTEFALSRAKFLPAHNDFIEADDEPHITRLTLHYDVTDPEFGEYVGKKKPEFYIINQAMNLTEVGLFPKRFKLDENTHKLHLLIPDDEDDLRNCREIGEAELCLMEIGRKNGKDPVNLTLIVTDYEGLFRHGILEKVEALPMSIGNYDYITWSQDYSQLIWHGKMMVHDNFPEHATPAFAWLSLKTKQDQVSPKI